MHLRLMVYAGCHEFILFFSFFLLSLYMHVRALYFCFSLYALNKLSNSYFIYFEYLWIFLLLLYFLFFVHVYYSIGPSWARAGCKKTLSLIHYPCEIKFIHSCIHSNFSFFRNRHNHKFDYSSVRCALIV